MSSPDDPLPTEAPHPEVLPPSQGQGDLPPSALIGIIAQLTANLKVSQDILPDPEILAAYDRIIPNGAQRIMTMAEEQATHRRHLERVTIEGDNVRSYLGLGAGFVVVLVFVWAAYGLIMAGHTIEGILIGAVDIVGLASAFIYSTTVRKNERQAKAQRVPLPEQSAPMSTPTRTPPTS